MHLHERRGVSPRRSGHPVIRGSCLARSVPTFKYHPDEQRLSGSMKTFQHNFMGEDSRSLDLWLVEEPLL